LSIRINKYLADSGVGSRRKCDELIIAGKVIINGAKAELGSQVTEGDKVELDGKPVSGQKANVYYMLNKPVGYVTTVSDDRGRRTVMELLPKGASRVFPVGRLDYDTSGLLLLTNDGDLAYKLTHPSKETSKTYVATVLGNVTDATLNKLRNGVDIDGFKTSKAGAKLIKAGDQSVVELIIHEGKNRQVRRMFDAVGHKVVELKRVAIGSLVMGSLKIGKIRELTKDEIIGR